MHTNDRKSPKGGRTRALSAKEVERVRTRLRELAKLYGTEKAAAAKVGFSQQSFNRIVNKEGELGLHVARKVAAHDGLPLEFFLDGTSRAFRQVVRKFPNRWSPDTLAAVFRWARTEEAEGLSDEEWVAKLDAIDAALSSLLK